MATITLNIFVYIFGVRQVNRLFSKRNSIPLYFLYTKSKQCVIVCVCDSSVAWIVYICLSCRIYPYFNSHKMHISALRSTTATKITFKQFTFQFEVDENGSISSIYAFKYSLSWHGREREFHSKFKYFFM